MGRADEEQFLLDILEARNCFSDVYRAIEAGRTDEALLHTGIGESKLNKVLKALQEA